MICRITEMHNKEVINVCDGTRLGPVDDLPEDTSIRRAFKQRLQQGKPTGYGYGVILFDGEKILGK